jgi:4-hydroxybenzoate polyprenyltransferase
MQIIDKFINGGGVLALSGSGMALTATILLGMSIAPILLLIVFLVVFSSYHINRKAEIKMDVISHPERTKIITEHKQLDSLAVFAFIIAAFLTFFTAKQYILSLFLVIVPPLTVALYSIDWIPHHIGQAVSFKRFKEIPIIKNALASGVWGLIAFLTTFYYGLSVSIITWFVFFFIYIRFFINTVVFDMRDTFADSTHGVKTIPVLLGLNKTKSILLILNTVAAVFLFYAVWIGWLPFYAHALNLITFYGYYFILKSTDKKTDQGFLCDVIVDGEFILWPILLLAGKLILS